ncbi:CarD family transcriptional regulator [Proteinivorax hydrogeniformans]|uniref:CarD family transcriptional regulator n=1 Tax=Proteinivorax hydrogeniformans TaxID=1826727 RepID=A0AAU8HV90_9FIRM
MFKINDHVVYQSSGVYKIVDIRKEKDFNKNDTEYYVMEPVFNNNLTTKIPVNNKKVMMRNVITKDEALALITSMPEEETVWLNNNRERSGNFKEALKSGKTEEWARIIKTIYLHKQERNELGKTIMKSDEDAMENAEKILNQELAVALNILPEEVPAFIKERLKDTD